MRSDARQIRYGVNTGIGTVASSIGVLAMAAIILMWLSLSAGGADVGSEPNHAASSPADIAYENARILFSSDRDGDWEIYVVGADGSGLKKLTDNSFDDGASGWSPDGEKILFSSDRDGDTELYIMNADGTEPKRLTYTDSYRVAFPRWSPDGEKIAFSSMREPRDSNEAREWREKEFVGGFHMEIYVMNADGSGLKRLTGRPVPSTDFISFWSPDGKKITYTSIRNGNYEIYVMNSDGTGQKRLTNDPALEGGGLWSPDGKKLLFVSDRSGKSEVYVMNPDGTEQKRLTYSRIGGFSCEWSPDGTKIAYVSTHKPRDGKAPRDDEIRVINADGSKPWRLTFDPALDQRPCWSPDGKRIAYQSYRGERNIDIYVIDPDGRNRRRLTDHPARDVGPCWSPLVAFGAKVDEADF